MICYKCNKLFYVKRGLLDLFKEKKEYLCNDCYRKYPIELKMDFLQFDYYSCTIISMFKKRYPVEYNWYYREYSKIFEAYINKDDYHILFFNFIELNQDTMEVLNALCYLFKRNIIVICFYLKN